MVLVNPFKLQLKERFHIRDSTNINETLCLKLYPHLKAYEFALNAESDSLSLQDKKVISKEEVKTHLNDHVVLDFQITECKVFQVT